MYQAKKIDELRLTSAHLNLSSSLANRTFNNLKLLSRVGRKWFLN